YPGTIQRVAKFVVYNTPNIIYSSPSEKGERNISSASFINITIPMWVIQADLYYMSYDQIRNKIYKFAFNYVDIATRIKWSYPLTKRNSASVAIDLEKLFNSQKCIVEKFNKTLQEWSSIIQDAVDMRLPISE
ncbi:5593_t:CDS:2, partial [Funneliformis geosporum]